MAVQLSEGQGLVCTRSARLACARGRRLVYNAEMLLSEGACMACVLAAVSLTHNAMHKHVYRKDPPKP